MPGNEKTKDNFIQIYFKEVSSSQYAAGESGLIPVTVCGGMRTGKAENIGNAFLHPVPSTTHPPKGKKYNTVSMEKST